MKDMSIKITNDRELNVAEDFVKFIGEHNKRAMAKQTIDDPDGDTYDLLIRQASLINTMAKTLAVKQVQIDSLKGEIDELKSLIEELEQEIRVSKDLLTIAGAVKSGNSEENH